MTTTSKSIRNSEEYKQFRANVPLTKLTVNGMCWQYYDIGPREKNSFPVICIPGTSSSGEVFLNQLLSMAGRGQRTLAIHYPPVQDHAHFVHAFDEFIHHLGFNKVHLYGVSLGGFLCVHYWATFPKTVASIMLSNAFIDNRPFQRSDMFVKALSWSPEFYLKKFILDSFPTETSFPGVVDFVVESLEQLGRSELASRLTLNLLASEVKITDELDPAKLTICDSADEVVLPQEMRDRLYAAFPNARYALLKVGGDFPYLTVPDEVNLHLTLHVRRHTDEPSSSLADATVFPLHTDSVDGDMTASSSSTIASATTSPSSSALLAASSTSPFPKLLPPTLPASTSSSAASSSAPSPTTASSKPPFESLDVDDPHGQVRQQRIPTEDRNYYNDLAERQKYLNEVLEQEVAKKKAEEDERKLKLKQQQAKQQMLLSTLVDTDARPQVGTAKPTIF